MVAADIHEVAPPARSHLVTNVARVVVRGKRIWMERSSPIAPEVNQFSNLDPYRMEPIHERFHELDASVAHTSTISCASDELRASGFSHNTCFPARAAAMTRDGDDWGAVCR